MGVSRQIVIKEKFLIFGSGPLQEFHRRWFENHLPKENISYKNCSDEWHGIAISGPKSRELLLRITREDMSNKSFKFLDINVNVIVCLNFAK